MIGGRYPYTADCFIFMKTRAIFLGIIFLAISIGVVFGRSLPAAHPKLVEKIVPQQEPTLTPTPLVFATPVNLSIPKLGIMTTVESVGLDVDKNMDVPKEDMNVGWYRYGITPGNVGNAVLAGHFDKKDGSPAIFYRLAELVSGDEVVITDEKGEKYTFAVVEKQTYPVDQFPIETVFGKATDRYLNLITCGGAWNTKEKGYTQRIVVRAKLAE